MIWLKKTETGKSIQRDKLKYCSLTFCYSIRLQLKKRSFWKINEN